MNSVITELAKLAQLETGAPGYDSWVRHAKPIRTTENNRPEHEVINKAPAHEKEDFDTGAPKARSTYDTSIDIER